MCAICGIYDEVEPPAEGALRAMMDAQAHRGPDGAGLVLDGPISPLVIRGANGGLSVLMPVSAL